jgi:hypothetical protein
MEVTMDAHEIRMRIKALIEEARDEFPEFDFVGEIDETDVLIEALIHPERFEVMIRTKE